MNPESLVLSFPHVLLVATYLLCIHLLNSLMMVLKKCEVEKHGLSLDVHVNKAIFQLEMNLTNCCKATRLISTVLFN